MKRFLCAMLIAILVLAFCVSACAVAYTHPSAGFSITVPDGWIAIDSANADEVIASGRLSADMAATVTGIRAALDSQQCVFMFKEDVVTAPFVNISVTYQGDNGAVITPEELLAIIQSYEEYYLEETAQFPEYTVMLPASVEQEEEGVYPLGFLGGTYTKNGYTIAFVQSFIAAGAHLYDVMLTAEPDKVDSVMEAFGIIVSSLATSDAAYSAVPSAGEIYTHPVGGYGFAVPDGWVAIDGVNANAIVEGIQENAALADTIRSAVGQIGDMPIVMLYEKEKVSPVFQNNINVTLQDVGGNISIDDVLAAADSIYASYAESIPGFVVEEPMTALDIGSWKAALMSGSCIQGGNPLTIVSVRLVSGTMLYDITLTALTEEVEPYFEVLGALVGTFFTP